MIKEHYVIHEVAKEVNVEAHVLRYWEEELDLPILRNDKGHRLYSEEDIRRFIRIKNLRDQGLQLRAIKRVLEQWQERELDEPEKNYIIKNEIKMKDETKIHDFQQEKIARMQFLFQKLIKDIIEENNNTLVRELSENLKEDVCKELDYQFRLYEDREDERERARIEREEKYILSQRLTEEAHFKHIDEMLRQAKEKTKRKEPKRFLNLQRVNKMDESEDVSV